MNQNDYWTDLAASLLKAEMKLRGLTYETLNNKLKNIEVEETIGNTSRKIARGKFSLIYFLQCLKAMNVDKVDFKFYFNSKEKNDVF